MTTFKREADDGSWKSFEPVREGRQTLLITESTASPQVNPHILSLVLEDSDGREMKAKFDQTKKTSKGKLAQRFYMNQMIDAVLGEDTSEFNPAQLSGLFIDADVTHADVHKKDKETGELMYELNGDPMIMTFANLGTVYGLGTPFKVKSTIAGDDLDEQLGL